MVCWYPSHQEAEGGGSLIPRVQAQPGQCGDTPCLSKAGWGGTSVTANDVACSVYIKCF